MVRLIITFAAANALLSVMLGAFASHGLRGQLDARMLSAFETGVAYQMTHSLALLALAMIIDRFGRHWTFTAAAAAFAVGIVLFSGSLYLLAMTGLRWIGPVTPMGGVGFIVGWALLAAGAWNRIER